jgi:succinoglycan biosynthesis protein ExoA
MREAVTLSGAAVTVIVPCYNEVDHIAALLQCIFGQEPVEGGFEVIIADGMSNDGTRSLLGSYMASHPELRVIDNPGRFVSSGLNRAINASRGEIIVRMDVHTQYAPDYISQCVRVLKRTKADSVGGPWRATGKTYFQKAIATAFQSKFSSGGAPSHRLDYEGRVDSVYLGCWRKETLERLGGFDQGLIRNQDDDLSFRLIRLGGWIWQDQAIKSWYYPRSSLRGMLRQYAQYGYWKVRVIQKHRRPASVRHLIPGLFVAINIILGVFAVVERRVPIVWLVVLAAYLVATVVASVLTCASHRKWRFLPVMPIVFGTFHVGYGYGFLRGTFDFVVRRKAGAIAFSKVTR